MKTSLPAHQVTTREYCDSNRVYTTHHQISNSLFPGVDFDSLDNLLRQRSNQGGPNLASDEFVTFYRFHPGGERLKLPRFSARGRTLAQPGASIVVPHNKLDLLPQHVWRDLD
jgi:hypothetical protein